MSFKDIFNDTICAPATIPGTGAIAIVRLSGSSAFEIADRLIRFRKKGSASSFKGYTIHFGEIFSGDSLLDEVLTSIFHSPNSYTGEDSVEIYCHSSTYIVSEILRLACEYGARVAEPGEFTKRAFVNGKMDLTQAEAVADVISSTSSASHRVALSQMRGGVSSEIHKLRDRLVEMTALLELELDFSEEDVEFADRTKLTELLQEVLGHIDSLCKSFRYGNALSHGVPVAIAGAPNSGKSTLLNRLVGDDRAIVSEIPGTTRDTVEEYITLQGVRFRFIDTAGLRDASDSIEKLGIERSRKSIREASVVIAVIDSTLPEDEMCREMESICSSIDYENQRLILLLNKSDLREDKLDSEDDLRGDKLDFKDYLRRDKLDSGDDLREDKLDSGDDLRGDKLDSGDDLRGDKLDSGDDLRGDKLDSEDDLRGDKLDSGDDLRGDKLDSGDDLRGDKLDSGDDLRGDKLDSEDDLRGDKLDSGDDLRGDKLDSEDDLRGDKLDSGGNLCFNKNVTTLNNIVSCTDCAPIIIQGSGKTGFGINELESALLKCYSELGPQEDATLITNSRHYEALVSAAQNLRAAADGLPHLSSELIAEDLRAALSDLRTITGEITSDDVLGEIFGRFCIGK